MNRRVRAVLALSCVGIGACQIDSRNITADDQGLRPPSYAGGGSRSGAGLVVQPSSIPFGPITQGFAASAHLFVQNVGTTPLAAPAVSLGGEGASAFTVTQNDCIAALVGGAHCAVALAFLPTDLDARMATVALAVDGARVDIPLSGSGLEPGELLLQPAPGGAVLFADVLFGDEPILDERVTTLRLSNPAELDSGPIQLTSNNGAFTLLAAQGSECASGQTRLAGGQSCDLRVRFVPLARGVAAATITVESQALGSVSLSVSGTALSPARLLAPAQLDFGDAVEAVATVLDLLIRNGGDEPMPPVASVVTGERASDFRVSANTCSALLPAAASCSISVSFTPGAVGLASAALELDAGPAGFARVDLLGTGLPLGDLVLAAADGSSNDFGPVLIGTNGEQVFQVTNPTDAASGPLELAVNSEEFALLPPTGADCISGETDLGAGERCDVRVAFAPVQRQRSNALLIVSSSGGGRGLNLSGLGLAPAALQAQGPVDFGGVPLSSTAVRTLNVTNAGDVLLGDVAATVSGPNAGDFAVQENGCAPGLAYEAVCPVAIAFTPSASGSRLATLTLVGAPGGTRNVALSGTGLEPGSLVLAPARGASASFGDGLVIGSGASQTRSFVLSNPGSVASGPINITPLAGAFRVTPALGTDCISNTTSLQPGATCTISVEFTPVARGSNTATLIVSSAATGSTSLALSGTGLAAALLGVQPNPMFFGNPVLAGQRESAVLTVRNQGDQATGAVSGSIFGVSPGFGVTAGTCSGALAGGASCELNVAFAPTTSGLRGGTVRVQSMPGGVVDVPVSGTGQLPAALVLSAATSDSFGAVAVNTSATLGFTLRNTGDLSAGRLLDIALGTGFARATGAGECVPNVTLLDVGASCTFRVVFQPVTVGSFFVTMVATSQLGGSANLPIGGSATAPAALSAPTALAFVERVPPIAQGSETQSWVVTNTGGSSTQPLVFTTSNPEEFRVISDSTCMGATLAPGNQCAVNMQFAPDFEGARSATLTVTAGSLSVSATITGFGGF